MNRRPSIARIAAILAAIVAVVPSQASVKPALPEPTVAPAKAFAQLIKLVGRWRPADRPESPLRIHFYLTAGGTTLVESWEAKGKPHSLTLYHRDGDALLATHYCPQGNQPRMVLSGEDRHGLHFALRDATDLDETAESHQHDLWLDLTDEMRPVRREIYRSGGAAQPPDTLVLIRSE